MDHMLCVGVCALLEEDCVQLAGTSLCSGAEQWVSADQQRHLKEVMELLREMPPRGLLPAASPKEVTELLRETLPRGLLPARGVLEGLPRGVLGPLRTTRTKDTAPRAARCTHLQGHVLLSCSALGQG